MPTTTTIRLRSFSGKIIPFEINLDERIGDAKPNLAKSTLRPGSALDVILTFNGHEMRNHRKFSWYGIQEGSLISVLPPRKAEENAKRLNLTCIVSGKEFVIDVDPAISVRSLIKEIEREERVPVHHLEYFISAKTADEEEWDLVEDEKLIPLDNEDVKLFTLPIVLPDTRSVIYVCPPPPPSVPPSTFPVTVALYEEEKRLTVDARLQMTLREFRLAVKDQCGVNVEQHVLILLGKALLDEDMPVWDLGFFPGYTIHAVPFVSFDIATADEVILPTMILHPLTKLSELRKLLEETEPCGGSSDPVTLDKYAFTLDGRSVLKEWRTLWGINLISGSTLYLRPVSTINITIRYGGRECQLDVEEDETIEEVQERFELISGMSAPRARMIWKNKSLQEHRTVGEEGIAGGDTIMYLPRPRPSEVDLPSSAAQYEGDEHEDEGASSRMEV